METGLLSRAKEIFQLESEAINNLSFLLTEDFEDAVKTILHSKGRLVISGMGKSGHIGVKISATLASTGTPSFFMHPAEAMHGDLGMLTKDDIVLAISNSGESEEILRIIPLIKRMDITLIGMSGKKDSTLANSSDYFLNIAVEKEACPLQLAPTTSTTATLVMGDALAIAIMEERGFKAEDFAMYHPGGSLGRKLLTKVSDIMSSKALPIVQAESSFQEIIQTMTQGKLGLAIVMENESLVGVISDGDLRRVLERNDQPRFEFLAKEIMTASPKTIHENAMADEAEQFMLKHKINDLVVVNRDNEVVGIVQLFDTGSVS